MYKFWSNINMATATFLGKKFVKGSTIHNLCTGIKSVRCLIVTLSSSYHLTRILVPKNAAMEMTELTVTMMLTLKVASVLVQPYSSCPIGASNLSNHK